MVLLHVIGIAVASRASRGHIGGVDGRPRVRGRTDIVNAMAVNAGGYLRVASFQTLAMHAREVLAQLIGAHLGIEPVHVSDVGVAARAEFRNMRLRRHAPKALGGAHGIHRLIVAVPAVTIHATQAGPAVNIRFVILDRRGLLAFQFGVTGDAGILRCLRQSDSRPKNQDGGKNGESVHIYLRANKDIAAMKPMAKTPRPVKNRVTRPNPAR